MKFIGDYARLRHDLYAKSLVDNFGAIELSNSFVYYNFPLFRADRDEEIIKAHILLVTKDYGVFFFKCIESERNLSPEELKLMEGLDANIFSKISRIEELRNGRRELKINLTPCFFVSEKQSTTIVPSYDVVDKSSLNSFIIQNKKGDGLTDEEFDILVSAIEGSGNINYRKKRINRIAGNETKGDILNKIQNLHAVFDLEQKKAALTSLEMPQRIRGLAGSGKTVILAMKAALFHLEYPEKKILYTYFTKALHGQVKTLIERFYRDFSDNNTPDWRKIDILHGWGGQGLRGVYSTICEANGIRKIGFLEAKQASPDSPFKYIFSKLNEEELKEQYDLTLIDEGQDFPAEFYQVCRKITTDFRIVWAYDDFQDIFDVNIQDEKITFGSNDRGQPYLDFSRTSNELQDIVLKVCYRNPRIVLISAFALGLGIYNQNVLQRLENNEHWIDLGFEVEKGDSTDGSDMIISRPSANSPEILNSSFDDSCIEFYVFDSIVEEIQFVANKIVKNIQEEGLLPEDISVVCLDNKNIAAYLNDLENLLEENKISCFNLLSVPKNNQFYNVEGQVTLSTLNKAKGNESGMVYIIGADAAFERTDYIVDRNKIFTAMTRAKGWVVMTGFSKLQKAKEELDLLKSNEYKFYFKQPSKNSTKTVKRGLAKQQEVLHAIMMKMEELRSLGLEQAEIIRYLTEQKKK